MHKILIVVDMQNDFVTGTLGSPEARSIVSNVDKKIIEYKRLDEDATIYFTRDTHGVDYLETPEGLKLPVEHCIYGSDGWQIVPELRGHCPFCELINKDTFGYDDWKEELKYDFRKYTIDSIELIGVCTDICVISNALILKALHPNIPIIVDASCCAGTTPENHEAALQVMKCCQIDVIGE